MSNEITAYRDASLDEKRAYVQTLASAGELLPKGLWANVKNPETGLMENRPSPGKVMLIVETGVMLGLHPMAALQGIEVIEGKPTLKPALMSALIREAGHILRIEQTGTVAGGDLMVTTTGIRSDDPDHPYVYSWTPFDAIPAGLIDSYTPNSSGIWQVRARSKDGKVLPWEAYTARMCRWRSLSDVGTAGFEDVLMGMHYTPDELGAIVNADGEVVHVIDADPSEDWAAAIAEATSKNELAAIKTRAGGEWNDRLNTAMLTRFGMLSRGEDVSTVAEPAATDVPPTEAPETPADPERDPAEPSDEEYEAMQAEQVSE